MKTSFTQALTAGAERVAAWSDLLDDINVFPVADGDTGRNLSLSLGPLMRPEDDPEATIQALLMAARGNSGNIAARFFSGFLMADSPDTLADAANIGCNRAWKAVHEPVPGTMLTVFDALTRFLAAEPLRMQAACFDNLVVHLAEATRQTTTQLPRLQQAGVVDAGALGMFIYFEAFFNQLGNGQPAMRPVTERFPGMLRINESFREEAENQYCVDTVIRISGNADDKLERLSEIVDSLVVIPHRQFVKVHLHTTDLPEIKERFEKIGDVIRWEEDDLHSQVSQFQKGAAPTPVHIMTDAAGSITRSYARQLGITLLDSYVVTDDASIPETRYSSETLYRLMRDGRKLSTCQASDFERHQHYQKALQLHDTVVYLCVGSAYTGNYAAASHWKQENDPDNRFVPIDTTAASGRLGLLAIAAARIATGSENNTAVIHRIDRIIPVCQELIFLDRLKYLAAGGRLSKTSAFIADAFDVKPIVSPTGEGAVKVGTVRSRRAQIRFALQRLTDACANDSAPMILLQYTDNRQWVSEQVLPQIRSVFPHAEFLLQPMSLTAGVHMGPGTWAVAFLPADRHDEKKTA